MINDFYCFKSQCTIDKFYFTRRRTVFYWVGRFIQFMIKFILIVVRIEFSPMVSIVPDWDAILRRKTI